MKKTRIKQILHEMRGGILRLIQDNLPSWPKFVIKDFVYPTLSNASNDQIQEFFDEYRHVKWDLRRDITFTIDSFIPETQDLLNDRLSGDVSHLHIPHDQQRHSYQKHQIQQFGIPTTPIIVFQHPDQKYEVLEGWHRITQLFTLHPEGFVYPNVFVGIV